MECTHPTHIAHLPHLGKWEVYCDKCGRVGFTHDIFADAVSVANRHTEIGGFERPPE